MSAINLDQKGISIDGPEFNAIAPNLQSNILKSHSRDNARLLFLKFTSEAAQIEAWIKNFISQGKYVISAADQKADTAAFKSSGISKTVANFYLSAKGYEHLGLPTDEFKDDNAVDEETEDDNAADENMLSGNNDFVSGMKSGSVRNKLKDPDVNQWEQEYATDIHAMVLLADDDATRLDAETVIVKNSLDGIAIIVKEEIGANLTGTLGNGKEINIEHFGYADGISQPRYFKEDPRTSPVDLQPLSLVLVRDPFSNANEENYGSFLVYRKLEQDVDGFKNKVTELSGKVNLTPDQKGKMTTEDYAGAIAVGRFKDGTPLVKSDIPLGESPAFNDFKYEQVDRAAHKCPFHAHIRKTNPRGQGLLVPERGRFITRRGMPYGKADSLDKKGLLFMCFQANLNRQFNFIQKTWANAPGFPPFRGRPGIDPLIGQGNPGEQNWPIQYGSSDEVQFNFAGFIKMKGGEYFFAPSIAFLKNI